MSTIIEEISSLSFSADIIQRTIELYQDIEGKPLKCGNTDVVDNYWIETHTLGCREAADRPEDEWMDEHLNIFEEYMNDGVSTVVGCPYDGIFITITPQIQD